MNTKQISELLHAIGIATNYKGYPYLVHVIKIACHYHNQPFPCIKDLFQQTADYYGVSPSIVIHDIRTLLRSYWNPYSTKIFSSLMHYPVNDKLTDKEFIAVIAEYLSIHS